MPYLDSWLQGLPDFLPFLSGALAWAIPLLIAITFHEAAHGYVAKLFGDPTAYMEGRMTLNPFKHIDKYGTILLPLLFLFVRSPVIFGYAKPVPVTFALLEPRRLGEFCVAFAGPGTNILLALAAAFFLHMEGFVTPEQAPWLYMVLYRFIIINCTLAVFNLVPLLPLDGGRMLMAVLPDTLRDLWGRTERAGMVLVILLMLVPPYFGFDVLMGPVKQGTAFLVEVVLAISGNGERYEG
jgi:Zn-dependent protease